MKKNLLLLILMLLPLVASADAVEIDGIYYNLVPRAKVAEVTSNPNKYIGDVVIPETVTYDGAEYSVTSIDERAFGGCSGLTSVTIPNSVTSIRKGTFDSCSGLTSVNIGSGIQTIDSDAFAHCSKLTDVYCYAVNVPSTNANAFKYSYIDNSTLHVPAASVSTYQSASPWKNFKNIVALDGSTPYMQKCATPTINYVNGKLTFHCETDDVEFVYNVGVSGKGNDVEIKPMFTVSVNATTPMFTVSVYATKAGYEDSKVATKEISIEGIGLKGDVNGDGEVGIGDIISITNIMAE